MSSRPGVGAGAGVSSRPGVSAGTGAGPSAGAGAGVSAGPSAGASYGAGAGTGASSRAGIGAGTGAGYGASYDSGASYGAGAGYGSSYDSGASSRADIGASYGADIGASYGASYGPGAGIGTSFGGRAADSGAGGGAGGGAIMKGSNQSLYKEDRDTGDARDLKKMGELKSGDKSKYVSISSASQNAKRQQQSANVAALKLKLHRMNAGYNDLVDSVKWNKLQMEKAEKYCSDINMKLKRAVNDYATAETKSSKSGSTKKEKTDTEAANTLMYTIKHQAKEICDNYRNLKDKYMKSVNAMNALKNKRDDLKKYYDSVASDADSGSVFGSMLSPIINIFFGDNANRDCSGQLGCGNGVDYTYPSPFNSSTGGMFTPQPYNDGIHF